MKVLVCGGRDYADWSRFRKTLNDIHLAVPITIIINGGASGADSMASLWAAQWKIARITVSAHWHKYGRAAGIVRNVKMLTTTHPDLVVAFPGGRGTAHMVEIAQAAGVRVIQVSTDEAS